MLAACALASTSTHAVSSMQFTSLDAASGFVSLGSQTYSFSISTPTSYLSNYQTLTAGTGHLLAQHYLADGQDFVSTGVEATSAYTSGIGVGSFTLTFATAVRFFDLGASYYGDTATAWTVNSASVTDGDVFLAGTYTFSFSFLYSGSATNEYVVSAGFEQVTAAVPLPGAAGLAAVGLVAGGRRRRR
jgi:hypothetical protein